MKFRYLLLSILTMLLLACGLVDFERPVWDVTLQNVPLMNEDFPASDLIGENIAVLGDTLTAYIDGNLEKVTADLVKSINAQTGNIPLISGVESTGNNFFLQSLSPDTEIRVVNGLILEGEMIVQFDNGDVNDVSLLTIEFIQLKEADGSSRVENITSSQWVNNEYVIDLAGLTLEAQDPDAEAIVVGFDVVLVSLQPDGTNVGSIKLAMQGELEFESFTGFINDLRALDFESDLDIDYPVNFENSVIVDQASIFFDVYNKIGFEFILMGDLVAFKDGAEIDRITLEDDLSTELKIDGNDAPGSSKLTEIEIVNDARVNEMIRLMPDNINFVNPYYSVNNVSSVAAGFVSNADGVYCDYRIEVPLIAEITSDYFITPEKLTSIEIDKSNQDILRDRVNSGNIELMIDNGYPLGGSVDVFIASHEITSDSLSMMTSEIQLLNNEIVADQYNQLIFIELEKGLENYDLNAFLNDEVFIRFRVKFNNTDGNVIIMHDDNINVNGSLNIDIHIED